MSILNAEKLLLFGIRQNGELSGLKMLYGEKDLHFWTNEDDWKCEVIGNIFDSNFCNN